MEQIQRQNLREEFGIFLLIFSSFVYLIISVRLGKHLRILLMDLPRETPVSAFCDLMIEER